MAKTVVSFRKALAYFIAFTVFIVAAVILLNYFVPEIISPHYPWYLIFNFVIYALALYIMLNVSRKHDPEKFVMIFLAATVGKMLLAMIFILIMVMKTSTEPVKDAILFMTIYLIYLTQELVVLMKSRKIEN